MPERILIIEDDTDIARLVQQLFESNAYEAVAVHDGEIGLKVALEETWDLILLDLSLPEISGIELLKILRDRGKKVPVIIVTAVDRTESVVESFEIGANDYVTKPFNTSELLARVRNMLNIFSHIQDRQPSKHPITVGDLHIDPESRKVTRGEDQMELTPKEFDLLCYLASHKNKVCSRENILNDVWGYDFMADTNVIDVFIRYLRQKIDKGRKHKMIQTVRGIGYSLRDPESTEMNEEEQEEN
ncbi:DNA-binding response regulator [Paenibacillus selenitireducens]|uniref:DNA-binding response regulator n=1 Tax=Paenibacillus selenitireducens TaxID=1324314 RepID=A0A1T2X467_9BACL|nr:response regulator transcription factor [Paenibacillus selenitireducens]OPA74647.1 DNA-binding response regulator [Paenibacillus selenitireducens]